VTVALKLYLVIKSGASVSADLGSSSSYSNEIEIYLYHMAFQGADFVVKTVKL